MFSISLQKMGKDKRLLTERLVKNFDLLVNAENRIELLKSFFIQIATQINNLRKAEEIDICLYA